MGLKETGFLTKEELKKSSGYPSKARFKEGPVAVIECTQEIPCDPCKTACKFEAIEIGEPITNTPVLKEEECTGCGLCVAQCPGLAIFIVDKTYSKDMATVSFPHEYFPLPQKSLEIEAVNRKGEVICTGKVTKVLNSKKFDRTPVITIAVPKDKVDDIRGIKI